MMPCIPALSCLSYCACVEGKGCESHATSVHLHITVEAIFLVKILATYALSICMSYVYSPRLHVVLRWCLP